MHVELNADEHLLVEVTGIDGSIRKASGKIGQALQTRQEARDTDRAVLLANTHRQLPVPERSNHRAVTNDALKLLVGMNVVVATTSTLFMLWADGSKESARRWVEGMLKAPGGMLGPPED